MNINDDNDKEVYSKTNNVDQETYLYDRNYLDQVDFEFEQYLSYLERIVSEKIIRVISILMDIICFKVVDSVGVIIIIIIVYHAIMSLSL